MPLDLAAEESAAKVLQDGERMNQEIAWKICVVWFDERYAEIGNAQHFINSNHRAWEVVVRRLAKAERECPIFEGQVLGILFAELFNITFGCRLLAEGI